MKRKIIYVILIFLSFFILYFYIVRFFYPNLGDRSYFGSMFGGIESFFSGLAFLGVVYTIFLQRQQLTIQKRELEITREELKRTAEAQEESQKILSKQAESLKLTAKLNGLSSLLQRYTVLRDVGIAKYGSGGVDRKWDEKAEKVIEQIDDIISKK